MVISTKPFLTSSSANFFFIPNVTEIEDEKVLHDSDVRPIRSHDIIYHLIMRSENGIRHDEPCERSKLVSFLRVSTTQI